MVTEKQSIARLGSVAAALVILIASSVQLIWTIWKSNIVAHSVQVSAVASNLVSHGGKYRSVTADLAFSIPDNPPVDCHLRGIDIGNVELKEPTMVEVAVPTMRCKEFVVTNDTGKPAIAFYAIFTLCSGLFLLAALIVNAG